MKVAVSSDERTELVDAVLRELELRGCSVEYFGPEPGEESGDAHDWPLVTYKAAEKVARGEADLAVVMCWTGTGASLAANKVSGVRAALCSDAETARGARVWNHANALALSLRATTPALAQEILKVWFDTPLSTDDWNQKQIERIAAIEKGESPE